MSTTESPYRVLQRRAKAAGLPANKSAQVLRELLGDTLDTATTAPAPKSLPEKKAPTAPRTMRQENDSHFMLGLWPDGVAGISNRGIFAALPSWVNSALPPGGTSQVEQLGLANTTKTVLTLRHMLFSPNLVWFAIALALHVGAPYDFEAAKKGFATDWILRRFALNYAVAFAYYAFFFVGLYMFKWSDRKYLPGSYPTLGNMAHNMWYWSLGIVQWTWWEAVMVRLWATNTVEYQSWDAIKNDRSLLAINALWVVLIPVWRDVHFYIAHRFLHVRSIYTYVHKLHHRNADPEPFSGMTMHPIEHLYYFSNAFTPSLYMSSLSPLIFTWNFIHLTIAPGAGHSGWEDHFQSDQYHYLHHAKFECNYGSPMSGCVDQALGTFREKLGESKAYTGEWKEANDDNREAVAALEKKSDGKKVWSPHGYLGFPASWDHAVYTAFWVALFPLVWYATTNPAIVANAAPQGLFDKVPFATAVAVVVAYTPVPFGMALSKLSGDRMDWRWPFQKESFFGVFGLFLLLAWAACILPMYHATKWIVEVQSA